MHKTIDPTDISARLSSDDYQSFISDLFSQGDGDYKASRQLEKLIVRLPDVEAATLRLNKIKKIKQTTLARIFNVSQPTIHSRIDKAMKRLQFLANYPTFDKPHFNYLLRRYTTIKDDRYWDLYVSTSFQKVAVKYNTTPQLLRKKVKSFAKSAQWGSSQDFYKVLTLLHDNAEIMSGQSNVTSLTEDIVLRDGG